MATVGAYVPLRGDLAWRDRAACVGGDPDLWSSEVPPSASGVTRDAHDDQVRMALAVCDGCPVKAECLADAYATGDRWTVRGGTTGDERVVSRRMAAIRDLNAARKALEAATTPAHAPGTCHDCGRPVPQQSGPGRPRKCDSCLIDKRRRAAVSA